MISLQQARMVRERMATPPTGSVHVTSVQTCAKTNSMLSNNTPNIPNVNSFRPKIFTQQIFTQQQTDRTTQAPNISNVISNRKICVKINKARCDSCRPLNGVRGSVSRPASAIPLEGINKSTLLPREELVSRFFIFVTVCLPLLGTCWKVQPGV